VSQRTGVLHDPSCKRKYFAKVVRFRSSNFPRKVKNPVRELHFLSTRTDIDPKKQRKVINHLKIEKSTEIMYCIPSRTRVWQEGRCEMDWMHHKNQPLNFGRSAVEKR
jgi:IS4 transposase